MIIIVYCISVWECGRLFVVVLCYLFCLVLTIDTRDWFICFSSVMIVKLAVAVVGGLLGCIYVVLKTPPPKVCGSPGGPPITSPRVRLADGRHLAYKEAGISKENAKFKVIFIHGFASSKDIHLPISQVFLVLFLCMMN